MYHQFDPQMPKRIEEERVAHDNFHFRAASRHAQTSICRGRLPVPYGASLEFAPWHPNETKTLFDSLGLPYSTC